MKSLNTSIFLTATVVLFLSSQWAAVSSFPDTLRPFIQCLSSQPGGSPPISSLTYTQTDNSYSSIWEFSVQNLRFTTNSTVKRPAVIVTPLEISHIQATVRCAKKHDIQLRIRGGGHDFEGLSYVSSFDTPFVMLDLIKMISVIVDVNQKTAWVQAGATLGEVYYNIASKTDKLAFPAGFCPTVGAAGHISGGGYGLLLRKFGMAADNVIDAQIIDVNGRLLDRKSMGEDVFWAIRGNGGNAFGVVVAWKLQLVDIPAKATMCNIQRTLEQGLQKIVYKWQTVGTQLPDDMLLRIVMKRLGSTMQGTFESFFLGRVDQALQIFQDQIPELNVSRSECQELKWVQAVLFYGGHDINTPIEALRNRTSPARRHFPTAKRHFKAKSDFIRTPIPLNAWPGIFRKFINTDIEFPEMIMTSYGAKMWNISETALPFPHRAGNLYKILYTVDWEGGPDVTKKNLDWLKDLYSYMAPYVSQNPRQAYINYRDLDIGVNSDTPTVEEARVWGIKYFKRNFDRLVRIKTRIDPTNFFRNEQSIPPRVTLGNRAFDYIASE